MARAAKVPPIHWIASSMRSLAHAVPEGAKAALCGYRLRRWFHGNAELNCKVCSRCKAGAEAIERGELIVKEAE